MKHTQISNQRRWELTQVIEIADFFDSRGPVNADWVRKAVRELLEDSLFWAELCGIIAEAVKHVPDWDGDDGGVMIDLKLSRRSIHEIRAAIASATSNVEKQR